MKEFVNTLNKELAEILEIVQKNHPKEQLEEIEFDCTMGKSTLNPNPNPVEPEYRLFYFADTGYTLCVQHGKLENLTEEFKKLKIDLVNSPPVRGDL